MIRKNVGEQCLTSELTIKFFSSKLRHSGAKIKDFLTKKYFLVNGFDIRTSDFARLLSGKCISSRIYWNLGILLINAFWTFGKSRDRNRWNTLNASFSILSFPFKILKEIALSIHIKINTCLIRDGKLSKPIIFQK